MTPLELVSLHLTVTVFTESGTNSAVAIINTIMCGTHGTTYKNDDLAWRATSPVLDQDTKDTVTFLRNEHS